MWLSVVLSVATATGYLAPGVFADGFFVPHQGGQTVAMGEGVVLARDPLVVRHVYFENADRVELDVTYARKSALAKAARVQRGQVLFSDRVRATLSNGEDAVAFAQDHATLFVPPREPLLWVVDKADYTLTEYKGGKQTRQFKIGYGQEKGDKTVRGDNMTPRGMYFVVQKHRGEFSGPYGDYYGGHWIKVNYPNAYDADRGLSTKVIGAGEAQRIKSAWRKRKLTEQTTRLGSGIGFHGWIEDWSDDDPHLTWGCVVMHNQDIAVLYDDVPAGTMVVIR